MLRIDSVHRVGLVKASKMAAVHDKSVAFEKRQDGADNVFQHFLISFESNVNRRWGILPKLSDIYP